MWEHLEISALTGKRVKGDDDSAIKEFLDKILAPKPVVNTVPKKNLVIALPYLGISPKTHKN